MGAKLITSTPSNHFRICGRCFEPKDKHGYLCDKCLKEKWKNWNRNGLDRFEGVEYPCDCYGSGTDEKGRIVIISNKEKHAPNCSKFKQNIWTEPPCECLTGSTINNNGSISLDPLKHDISCHIRRNFNQDKGQ